jgi:hypothetical protein
MGGRKKAESRPGATRTKKRRDKLRRENDSLLRRGEDFRPRKWPVVHASFGRDKWVDEATPTIGES